MTETLIRAAGYIRVSTVSQAQDGESLNTQKFQIEAYCRSQSWELFQIFEDAGVSGAKASRPGLDALLHEAEQGKIQAVVVADLTRFGRSATDLLGNIRKLKDFGVGFYSIKGNVSSDGGPFGQLLLTILAATSEFEREMIILRTRENKMARWSQRQIYNGRSPYGYTWNRQLKQMEIHPVEGPIFLRIVSEYLDLGRGLKSISIGLNNDGIPTRIRGRWSSATISTILHSEAYCGHHTLNRHILDEKGNIKGDKPISEHITYEFPPLLTHERWTQLQERLRNSKVERGGRPSSLKKEFLLYGLLRCGNCYAPEHNCHGRIGPLYGHYRQDGTRTRFYGCYWNQTSGKALEEAKRERCTLPKIPADEIERFIWNRFRFVLFRTSEENFDQIFNTTKWAEKEEAAVNRIKSIKSDLRKAENSLKHLKGLLELDNVDLESYAADRTEAEQKILELKLRLEEANDELEECRKLRQEKESFLAFSRDQKELLKKVEKILDELPLDQKQKLLAGMLGWDGKIQVGPTPLYPPELPPPTIVEWYRTGMRPEYTWSDFLLFTWRPNVTILREILGPYLGDDGGGNGGNEGDGGGGKGTGKSCTSTHLPRQVHAGGRHESLPLRLCGRPGKTLHLLATGRDEIPEQDFGTDPGPDRPAHRGPFGKVRAVARRRGIGKVCRRARAGVAGQANSVEAAFRRADLLEFPDEAQASQKVLPTGCPLPVNPGQGGPAAGP